MPSNARIGDNWSGVCNCHESPISMSGVIITAASTVFVNGRGQARLMDLVVGSCGHTGLIISASPNCFAEGRAKARVGDSIVGCCVGTIVSGSPDSFSN